jgi:hypothetical protein
MANETGSPLNESTIRRFMALAGVESLVNPFLKNVNEQAAGPITTTAATDVPEIEPVDIPTTTTPKIDIGQVAEAEELEEIEDKSLRDVEEGVEELEEDKPKKQTAQQKKSAKELAKVVSKDPASSLEATPKRTKEIFATDKPKGKQSTPRTAEPATRRKRRGPETKSKSNESKNSSASRTLAESILRHIPNLEIVDDESTFKTERQSDILQEVLRRVKRKLS